jgi:plasmid segregation protein ParM
MKPYRMGIDIGFGDVKVVASGLNGTSTPETKQLKFPSAVSYMRKATTRGLENTQTEYLFEDRRYILGDEALSSFELIPTRDISFIMGFSPLLVFKALSDVAEAFQKDLQEVVKAPEVCMGLPMSYYFEGKEKLEERLTGFKVQERDVSFGKLDIYVQGQGILLDFLFDDQRRLNKEWFGKNLIILDVGFNTVDVLCIDQGKTSAEWSETLEGAGICRICRHIRIEMKEMGFQNPAEQEAKAALYARKVSLFGEEKNLSSLIAELSQDYGEYLYREFITTFSEFLKKTDKVILAGGGAYYAAKEFKKRFPRNFIFVPPEPEFSNARGYLKYLSK